LECEWEPIHGVSYRRASFRRFFRLGFWHSSVLGLRALAARTGRRSPLWPAVEPGTLSTLVLDRSGGSTSQMARSKGRFALFVPGGPTAISSTIRLIGWPSAIRAKRHRLPGAILESLGRTTMYELAEPIYRVPFGHVIDYVGMRDGIEKGS